MRDQGLSHGRCVSHLVNALPFGVDFTTALSRGLHFNRQFQAGTSDLILEREPYRLSFALVERLREASCPLRTNRSTPLLDITEVRPRDTKNLCKFGKAPLVGLAQARKCCSQREWPSHKGFEEL
jgi:hypothetical protein